MTRMRIMSQRLSCCLWVAALYHVVEELSSGAAPAHGKHAIEVKISTHTRMFFYLRVPVAYLTLIRMAGDVMTPET